MGRSIIPGKSGESRLVMMLEGKVQPRMPFGSDPLPAADIATIKAWIDAGGVGPSAGEAAPALAPLAIPDIKPEVPVVSPIASLQFSPDGKLLAVGAYREVRLIDPATNKLLATLPGSCGLRALHRLQPGWKNARRRRRPASARR